MKKYIISILLIFCFLGCNIGNNHESEVKRFTITYVQGSILPGRVYIIHDNETNTDYLLADQGLSGGLTKMETKQMEN